MVDYLNPLADEAEWEDKPVVVVLDRAPFHRAKVVKEGERPRWEAKGLKLYYLPSYCPHLTSINPLRN